MDQGGLGLALAVIVSDGVSGTTSAVKLGLDQVGAEHFKVIKIRHFYFVIYNYNIMVIFNEREHKYIDDQTGKELISATTLIGKYKPRFDKMGNAKRVAKREGVTVDFILEEWEIEKNRACDYGTNIHKIMEDFLSKNIRIDGYDTFYTSYKKWDKIFDKFPTLTCEMALHNIDLNIAGTADLVYENKNYFYIGDFKTNKNFRFF